MSTMSPFEEQVVAQLEDLKKSQARLEKSHERVEVLLTGGDEPDHGLILKVASLREESARNGKLFWLAVAASVTAVGHSFLGWFSFSPGGSAGH